MADKKIDRIQVRPEDILTGRDLVESNSIINISDAEIRNILQRYSPVLHRAIDASHTFFSKAAGGKLAHAVPLEENELVLWNGLFGASEKVLEHAMAGKLYVPDVTEDETRLLTSNKVPDKTSSSTTIRLAGHGGGKPVRINLDQRIEAPIIPFDPEGFRLFLRLHAHFGGYGGDRKSLYNAFIAEDVFVQDKYGRWVVDYLEGTGIAPWMGGPVYKEFKVASSHVWFNTRIKPEEPNSWEVNYDHPDDLMMGIDIHHPEQLDQLKIPNDPRQRFFFWQLRQFMTNPKIAHSQKNLLTG